MNTLIATDTAAPALWDELIDCTLNGLPSPLNPFSTHHSSQKFKLPSAVKHTDALAQQLERILPPPYECRGSPEEQETTRVASRKRFERVITKQLVGVHLGVWVRSDLLGAISDVRVSNDIQGTFDSI